jgi:hypothetical protein
MTISNCMKVVGKLEGVSRDGLVYAVLKNNNEGGIMIVEIE